jgi:hypothetical protein
VADIISDLPAILTERDAIAASEHLDRIHGRRATEMQRMLSVTHEDSPESMLALGLFHGHISTMLGHAANVASSVTQPVQRLDHAVDTPR